MFMRHTMKFLHTLSSCGVIGALFGYAIVLGWSPQGTPAQYADVRQTIDLICDYMLVPSLGLSLVTGLLAMAVHQPYQNKRWAWVKAATGIGMFEATLAITNAKAEFGAKTSAEIAARAASGSAGTADLEATLATALASEWTTLWALLAIAVANIVLGVWRPKLHSR